MYLKNKTSKVSADVTMQRIERLLVSAGATGFQKLYANKICSAIIFEIEFEPGKKVAVKLPAKVDLCRKALWNDCVKTAPNTRKSESDFNDQAERTAWRIVQEWVEVQVTLITLRQIDFLQAFMSHVWDGEMTYYERLQQRRFAGLLPAPNESNG